MNFGWGAAHGCAVDSHCLAPRPKTSQTCWHQEPLYIDIYRNIYIVYIYIQIYIEGLWGFRFSWYCSYAHVLRVGLRKVPSGLWLSCNSIGFKQVVAYIYIHIYMCVCFALLQITISNFPRPRITMDFALPRPLSTVISGPYKLSMAIDGQSRQSTFVRLSLNPIFLKRSAAS